MPTIRFPVLLWKDFNGYFGACAAHEPADSAAFGTSRADVLEQVKDYFAYSLRISPWKKVPELDDIKLTNLTIPVRPEYGVVDAEPGAKQRQRRQIFASPPVQLPVAVIHAIAGAGLIFAAAPLLGVSFVFDARDKLKDTVTHYVQQALRGRTLEQLMRLLPPQHIELEELIVRVEERNTLPPKSRVPTLEAIADPISDREFKTGLSRPWQRDVELQKLVTLLTHDKIGGGSLILVGSPGVGKSSLLIEAAREAQRQTTSSEDPADELLTKPPAHDLPRFWLTSGARIIAGMRYLGQWQERTEALIAELAEINGGGTLCIERLQDLILSGGRDPSAGIGAFLIPYLRRGELRLITEATPEELDACRRILPGLVDVCAILVVEPLSGPQTIAALEQVGKVLSQSARTTLDPAALPQIHRLFARFQPYHPMPGPAVNFLSELLDHASTKKIPRVGAELVLQQFTRRTGLPEWLLRDELPLHREEILAAFERQIIGQPEACRAAADVILSFKAGLNDPQRPLGVILFAGPTGVGKTEMARTIASYLFSHGDKKDRLTRLDMSEFSGHGDAERLIGQPDGEPGVLIRTVRQQPFSVVLLDEIEKAAPEVFDLLLGLFDEGRLTDRFGRLTTFRSAILIMTSNLGSTSTEPFGISPISAKSHTSEIAAHFRPEFFNRIDNIVTFAPLSLDSMRRIAELELQSLARREGLAMRKITLRWTPELLDHLVAAGFDKRYGARPLQRTIESLLATPLAKLLAGKSGKSLRAKTITLKIRADRTITFDPAE